MEKERKQEDNSRRKFLKLGVLAGAGTLAAGTLIATTKSNAGASGEKIKVLTTTGEVMEVDKNHLNLRKQCIYPLPSQFPYS